MTDFWSVVLYVLFVCLSFDLFSRQVSQVSSCQNSLKVIKPDWCLDGHFNVLTPENCLKTVTPKTQTAIITQAECSIINDEVKLCIFVGAAVAECSGPEAVLEVQSSSEQTEGRDGELVEEDLVAVSYMGDELDLETVGDIIAIIEEKVLRIVHLHTNWFRV